MLSVALCTYNGEKYLDQQLNSIFSQSKPINEIIICDDNSSDNTLEIVKKFQNVYPSVIKLHVNTTALGPIKNFEKAIGLCKGDIIFLSDQDDVWSKDKVDCFLKKFNESPFLEAVFSDGEMIDGQNISLGNNLWKYLLFDKKIQKKWSDGNSLFQLISDDNKITGATLAIKKDLFKRSYPFPQIKGVWHDVWLGLNAAANNTLGWIDLPLIKYRIHSNQQVGIGNGVTLSKEHKKKSLKELLIEAKSQYENTLFIIDRLAITYPQINKIKLQKEAVAEINKINFRLNLPNNLLVRTYNIFKNVNLYLYSSKVARTIIRDILNPCT